MGGYPIVLTADKTVMNTYGGGLFYGFIVTAPRKAAWYLSPERLLKFILRDPPSDENGRAVVAPQGLRRVEASLLGSGLFSESDVIVAVPHKLDKVVGSGTRVIGVSAIDPFGMGPASTTLSGPYGVIHDEANNAYHFRELVTSRVIQEARRQGTYLVVGGPGAWQLNQERMAQLGIDIAIVGEAELVFPELAHRIVRGEDVKTPAIISIPPSKYPSDSQIPLLHGATVGGLVEVSRGCGKGCRFCTTTLRKLRHRRLEDIIHDVEVNVRYGQRSICLHAEDILRYGSYTLNVEHERVVKLFSKVKETEGVEGVSVSHAALSSISSSPRTVAEISEILGLSERRWMGFQTGIESGSPRLMEKLMHMKPYPYKPSEWPEVVEEAFSVAADNHWVPCATLIVNLPGETAEDVVMTTELVERLYEYKSLIAPLLYVPVGQSMEWVRPIRFLEDAEWYHLELYRAVWRHNMRWVAELARDYSRGSHVLARIAIKTLVNAIRRVASHEVEKVIDGELLRRARKVKAVPTTPVGKAS